MISSLEMYVIYCVTIVATILLRLQLRTASLAACKPVFGSTLTTASAYNTESSGISAALLDCMGDLCALAFLSDLKRLVISAIFKSPPFLRYNLQIWVACRTFLSQNFVGYELCIINILNNSSLQKHRDAFLSAGLIVQCIFDRYLLNIRKV
jgi:hypothetical protein